MRSDSLAKSDLDTQSTCIGVLGTGTMASMLARCFSQAFPAYRLLVWGRSEIALSRLTETVEQAMAAQLERLAIEADFIFLAIPPQAYPTILARIREYLKPGTIIVSLTNGIPMHVLGDLVGNPVVKVIPTLAQIVGRGCVIVVPGARANGKPVELVVRLLAPFGKPIVIDDADSRVASNMAGSALAFIAEFAQQLILAHGGRETGLSEATLLAMLGETMGAVSDLMAKGYTCDVIAGSTATPGGITEAALTVLRDKGPTLIQSMIDQTFKRQAILGRELSSASSVDRMKLK